VDLTERLGREWEVALRKGDVSVITSRVDLKVIAAKALSSLPGGTEGRREFIMQYSAGAALNLETGLRGFSSFRFLGAVRTNAAGGVVFRGLLPDGGVNYHRYILDARGPSDAVISDVFVVSNGEWLSDSIRWLYLLSEGKGGSDIASKLTGGQAELVRNAAAVEKLLAFSQQRKYLEFVDAYKALPQALKEDRPLLQLQLVASLAVEPLEFGLASRLWSRLYPTHPGLDLVTFEKLSVRGEHARSAAALERIEGFVGGDVHLRSLRAAQLALAGDVAAGSRMAEEAMRVEPDLATGYDVAIGIGLKEKRFSDVVRYLDLAADHLPVDPREVVQVQPQYEAFRVSAEGRAWLAKKPSVNQPKRIVPAADGIGR
jgi:hypothetical protein